MTAWTTPRSWADGDVPGGATFNTHIRDNENFLYEQLSGNGWTTFTPTWTNLTVGNGTNTGAYAYAGRTTFIRTQFTFGSTSSTTGGAYFLLPQTAVASIYFFGEAVYIDSSTGIYYKGALSIASAAELRYYSASGATTTLLVISSVSPMTWATGDVIFTNGYYERA
jgi:hypothetical protein